MNANDEPELPASAPRRSRYARAAAPEHPLTGLKLEVLRLIAESQFLSTPQVSSLLGVSERAARSHLRDLFDMGLLEVIPVPRAALKMGEARPAQPHLRFCPQNPPGDKKRAGHAGAVPLA